MENSEDTSNMDSKSSLFEWSKSNILRFRNLNLDEKSEMKRLNSELKNYLSNVYILEEYNKALLVEIDKEKRRHVEVFTAASEFSENLVGTRSELEKCALDLVEKNLRNEENLDMISDVRQKISFFEFESNLFRKKIPLLEAQLQDFLNLKEMLVSDANKLDKTINAEKQRLDKTSSEIENSRKVLNSSKLLNKKIEFEIDTLRDEIAFKIELHKQELDEIKQRAIKDSVMEAQIDVFFRNELVSAIKQIKQDFFTLNEQQLQDYKKYKEEELDLSFSIADEENETRSRIDISMDLSNREFEAELAKNKDELNSLKKIYFDKTNKISSLENSQKNIKDSILQGLDEKNNEIDYLKQKNFNLITDLDYWEKYLRSKLENEIQTYRSILNCQYLIMNEESSEKTSLLLENVIARTMSPRVNALKSVETIETLKQIFNYFDTSKNGTINSSDFENIMEKLNVKISNEAYKQVCKDFDKEGKQFKF
jgi:hypothetical protein